MRIVVVVNASAGSASGRPDAGDAIAARLSAAGRRVELTATDSGGLRSAMTAAARSGADVVVAAGGDGTIACAAQALTGTGTALGIVPLGTMNMLARDLGVPLDLGAAVDAIAAGHTSAIDVGDVNGHAFLITSILGAPSRAARMRERSRGGTTWSQWWRIGVAGIRGFSRYPPLRMIIETERGRSRVTARALAVVHNDFDEGFGRVLTRSRLDGGRMTLYIAHNLGVLRIARLGMGMALGRWREAPGLERHRVRRLVIAARRRLRVMNDGEVLMLEPPLRYRIRPQALKVIVPHTGTTPQ